MDLSKHLGTAADAVKRRNYPLAVKIYGQILSLQPDNGDARLGLRLALFKKAAAKPSAKFIALLGGGLPLAMAGVHRILRQHAAASRALERYLVHDPLSEGANLKLGDSLAQAGWQHSALAVFQAYVEQQPRCLEACRRAGELLCSTGQLDDALAMYEQALKIDPRDQQSLKARKDLAAEGALQSTGMASAKSSRELIKDEDAQRRLAKADRLQLSPAEIAVEIQEVEASLAQQPGSKSLLLRMADLLEMENDLAAASDFLEQALAQDAKDSDLANRAGLLRLRLQEKKVQEARERGDASAAKAAGKALARARVLEYRRQVAHQPTDLGLRFQLGMALYATQDLDEAIAELQQAVADPRCKAEALLTLGRAFQGKGLHDLAQGQLAKALEISGDQGRLSKEILYVMGSVSQDMGDRQKALEQFSRIMEQDIGFRDVAQRVEELKASSST